MPQLRDKPPGDMNHLNRLLVELAGDVASSQRLKLVVANTVVGQLLPPGAVKGGSAMKMRLGDATCRFTTDLDVARQGNLDDFLDELREALKLGWGGFTGHVVKRKPAKPAGIPPAYVMQPFEVKLAYKTRGWLTVQLEIGHDEIGDTKKPDYVMADELILVFARLGLPEPLPVAVLSSDHQVAQKLHGATCAGSERAHDLVDLQLLMSSAAPELSTLRDTCSRLFAYRGAQSWPPTVTPTASWSTLYAEAAGGLDGVLADVEAAVAWTSQLIAAIDAAEEDSN